MEWSDPLVVAVVGIIATGLVQAWATRKAHKNALDLFERQATDQAQARAKEREEQRRRDHLADKREAYAAMLRALTEFEANQAAATFQSLLTEEQTAADQATDALKDRQRLLRKEVHAASAVIRLIAPTHVYEAAGNWLETVQTGAPGLDAKRETFIALARDDLGADQGVFNASTG